MSDQASSSPGSAGEQLKRVPSNRELAAKINELIDAYNDLHDHVDDRVRHVMDRIALVEWSAQWRDTPGDERGG